MSDVLAPLPIRQVAAWYGRLADLISQHRIGDQESLAARFLRHYLNNRDPNATLRFHAPAHLRGSSHILNALRYHRSVFLTQEQARITGRGTMWGGVLPRLQGRSGFQQWNLSRPMEMFYESLVEIGSSMIEIARIQTSGSAEERDLFTSLRGFQLRSRVVVTGSQLPSNRVRVTFTAWGCRVRDRYDFDYNEYLTLPNPDYGSSRPDAVQPSDSRIRVYHRNAQRLEEAGLAAPFNIETHEWPVTDTRFIGPAQVNPLRSF